MTVRMRHTRAHTKNRRSHHALSAPSVSNEAQDGAHLRHRVSPITGKYKGEQVLDLTKKEIKLAAKASAKLEAKNISKADVKKDKEELKKAKKSAEKGEEVMAEKIESTVEDKIIEQV